MEKQKIENEISFELQVLVEKFSTNLHFYKDSKNAYNEHSCRIEYIDPLLKLLGWDVSNSKGLAPQYREVFAENYSTQTDRPDYSLTLRGIVKLFIEAKKPSIDIFQNLESALQVRKYGWNAKHKIAVLTNFEYLIIYDTTIVPREKDNSSVARYRFYHFSEYVEKFDQISALISRDFVYSDDFDAYFYNQFLGGIENQKQQVDDLFLKQINDWRILLSKELYGKGTKYQSPELLNDVVQTFINQIIFLRICEDRNLPLYYSMRDTVDDKSKTQSKLEELFRAADKRYNSGMFSGEYIVFDASSEVIFDIIQGLYYPQSPYLFNIIEPNLLGKIYELFLTEQLIVFPDNTIGLAKKEDCKNRSVVTTPTEIVKYMTEKALAVLCKNRTPQELLEMKIADIACGSGVFLEDAFDYLQNYCIEWYLKNNPYHLISIGNEKYKLPLEEKKALLCSCIFGIDIDIHAVEVAKFSLLVKLIENETTPSVVASTPILPDLSSNIFFGNSLISNSEMSDLSVNDNELIGIAPFNWNSINQGSPFDLIIGNPPYVNTEGLHSLVPAAEFELYKSIYKSAYKQFDKYFLFLERAIKNIKDEGFVCYIIPNKFFKVAAGKNLRKIISDASILVSIDDFGDKQLFEDKTIYSSIVFLQKKEQSDFCYSNITSAPSLWAGDHVNSITLKNSILTESPWKLTTDIDFLAMLARLNNVAVPLAKYADIFNGIQTSAERPPIYWFSSDAIIDETNKYFVIQKKNKRYNIEKSILKPYFKPTKQVEKGLNSYSRLVTDKMIIFPYDEEGKLYSLNIMKEQFSGAYAYLEDYYEKLVPRSISANGTRDVPNATSETWYQYGRTQSLTAFINRPKLVVGILSKEPMYSYDCNNMLIASGGTAGYCAVCCKEDSAYALEYLQAWLSNPFTERILKITGSDFEGGFISRGTFVLPNLPFVPLDFSIPEQKALHDTIVETSRSIYGINEKLEKPLAKNARQVFLTQKQQLIEKIENIISSIYKLEFLQ